MIEIRREAFRTSPLRNGVRIITSAIVELLKCTMLRGSRGVTPRFPNWRVAMWHALARAVDEKTLHGVFAPFLLNIPLGRPHRFDYLGSLIPD